MNAQDIVATRQTVDIERLGLAGGTCLAAQHQLTILAVNFVANILALPVGRYGYAYLVGSGVGSTERLL
jgi:hypothetical protein